MATRAVVLEVTTPRKDPSVAPTLQDELSLSHRNARTDFPEIVSYLVTNLGPTLTAAIANKSTKTVERYSHSETSVPAATEQTLRNAHQVFTYVRLVDEAPTVRAWFMGMNPQLEDRSPVECLRDGRFHDVLAAAKAFVTGG